MEHCEFLLNKVASKKTTVYQVCLPGWKHLQIHRPLDQSSSSSIKAYGNGDLNLDSVYFTDVFWI